MPVKEFQDKELRGINLKQLIILLVFVISATSAVVYKLAEFDRNQEKMNDNLNKAMHMFEKQENRIKEVENQRLKMEIRQLRFEIIMKERGLMDYNENPE